MKLAQDISIWVHTSVASPYRQHLFEGISKYYPKSRFFFTVREGHSWLKYQAWRDSTREWKIQFTFLKWRIPLPRLTFVHLDYLWYLLWQPCGTIHLVGCVHGNFFLIFLFCLLRRSYFVIWTDAGFPDRLSDRPPSLWKRFLLKHTAGAFTAGRLGKAYFQKFGLSEAHIYNSYFSHDVTLFKAFSLMHGQEERVLIRKQLHVADSEFVVLCIARLLDWKRVEDLAQALLKIDREHSDVAAHIHWILIGDGEFVAYQEAVEQFRHIHFHYRNRIEYEKVKSWFCASDVFAFPSEGDIWGLVVNEALSLGLPVICTDRIGSSELVVSGVNGYILPVRSPLSIAEKILELYTNPRLLSSMKSNAKDIWNSWHSELAFEELERLINNLKNTSDEVGVGC